MTSIPKIERLGPTSYIVDDGQKTMYFSYQTCVAIRGRNGDTFRRDRNYSVTTAKHMRQMGVADWHKVSDETFERLAAI